MSFVWKAPQRLRTPEQVAREVHEVSIARGLDELATVMALMCIAVESDFWCPWNAKDPSSQKYPHDSQSDDGRSVGYFQQQNGRAGEVVTGSDNWWGPMADRMDLKRSANTFLDRLTDNYRDARDNPVLAGQFVQNVQRSAFPDRYAQKWDSSWALLRRALGDQKQPEAPVGFSGDPVWLEEVLRADLGDRLVVHEGWERRGTGNGVNGTNQMGAIWGVMIHHTGNRNETPERIIKGRPDLKGPLSQCLITPDGKCHLVAVGPCNHAGTGSYPGIPAGQGNQHLIGFECAWPTIREDGSYDKNERWPDAQIITMRDATAAVLKKLGHRADRCIGHKEWAGASQGKWDPGNIDMNWFRGEVQKDLDGFVFPGEQTTTPQPGPKLPPDYAKETWDQLRIEWPQLGGRTLVDTVAAIGEKLGIEGCYDTKAEK